MPAPPQDTLPSAQPHIDPALAQLRPTIDSLLAVLGQSPDSILLRDPRRPGATGHYEPVNRRLQVSPDSRNRRRTLAHETGHVLQFDEQGEFYNWLGGDTPRPEDLERFAEKFADAFHALSRRDMKAAMRKDVAPLAALLASRGPFASDSTLAPVRALRGPQESR